MDSKGGYVTVKLRIGSAQFARCTADVFDADTLTISSTDDGADIRVLGPGQWRECVVFEGSGDPHPAFAFISRTPCAPLLSPRALRGLDDDETALRLTRNEQLEGLADRGCDTWDEYRSER